MRNDFRTWLTTMALVAMTAGVAPAFAQTEAPAASEPSTPPMMPDQGGMGEQGGMGDQGGAMMGMEGMMGMEEMMTQMTQMMATCNRMMQAMMPAPKPEAAPQRNGG